MQQIIIGNSCSASVIIVQIKFHFECLHYLGSIVLHLQCLKQDPYPPILGPPRHFYGCAGEDFRTSAQQNERVTGRLCMDVAGGLTVSCGMGMSYVGRCRCIVFSRDAIIDLTAPDELQFNANNYYGSHHSTSIAVPTPPRAVVLQSPWAQVWS